MDVFLPMQVESQTLGAVVQAQRYAEALFCKKHCFVLFCLLFVFACSYLLLICVDFHMASYLQLPSNVSIVDVDTEHALNEFRYS